MRLSARAAGPCRSRCRIVTGCRCGRSLASFASQLRLWFCRTISRGSVSASIKKPAQVPATGVEALVPSCPAPRYLSAQHGRWTGRTPSRSATWCRSVNFRANRLCCEAADRAIVAPGGSATVARSPSEHIYRHHPRPRRIGDSTEGTEEVQMRRVAQYLFGFGGKRASKA